MEGSSYVSVTEHNMLKEKVNAHEVRISIAENNIKDMKDDLTAIKSNTTWIVRLIIGGIVTGVITGVIGIIFAANKML